MRNFEDIGTYLLGEETGGGSVTPSNNGFVVGGQIGCDYQSGAWVFGIRNLGDWSNLDKKAGVVGGTFSGFSVGSKSNWVDLLTARAGYAVGQFLPYMFGGFALGQANIVRTARIFGTEDNAAAAPGFTHVNFDVSATNGQYSHLIYGYTAGLGLDVNLVGGLFLRAEWEYVRFTSSTDTNLNTVRAGLGYKF